MIKAKESFNLLTKAAKPSVGQCSSMQLLNVRIPKKKKKKKKKKMKKNPEKKCTLEVPASSRAQAQELQKICLTISKGILLWEIVPKVSNVYQKQQCLYGL